MMTEISLNVLDVAENSIRAGASLIEVAVRIDAKNDRMVIVIKDDGSGMTKEQVANVEDPFFTTRTTRRVGLGVPFFKYAAESTGGEFTIESEPGRGTVVTATFGLSHIDRMPLGDMTSTVHTLVTMHPDVDFLYEYKLDDKNFILDTREFRKVLGDVPFNVPDVSSYIKDYLKENHKEVDDGGNLGASI